MRLRFYDMTPRRTEGRMKRGPNGAGPSPSAGWTEGGTSVPSEATSEERSDEANVTSPAVHYTFTFLRNDPEAN